MKSNFLTLENMSIEQQLENLIQTCNQKIENLQLENQQLDNQNFIAPDHSIQGRDWQYLAIETMNEKVNLQTILPISGPRSNSKISEAS